MSDKKKCPFCEAIALQRFIEEHHSKPAGFGMALSAALVSYAVVNGRKCGRTTDYMKDGKGYPHCGAHLDSGEKCDCRAAEADGNAEKELKERTKDNDN